jgi:hypothetical protein
MRGKNTFSVGQLRGAKALLCSAKTSTVRLLVAAVPHAIAPATWKRAERPVMDSATYAAEDSGPHQGAQDLVNQRLT